MFDVVVLFEVGTGASGTQSTGRLRNNYAVERVNERARRALAIKSFDSADQPKQNRCF